jgi:hypothetical protein
MKTYKSTTLDTMAAGDVHMGSRYRMDGVAPHPLQRSGDVGMASHSFLVTGTAARMPSVGDSVYTAGYTDLSLPPPLIIGGPRDPSMMV